MQQPPTAAAGPLHSLTDEEIEREIKRLEKKNSSLRCGNERLKNQITDIQDMMHVADAGYDKDVQQLAQRNRQLAEDKGSLEHGLETSQKHSAHL